MREIKFRAWNHRRKKMESVCDLYWFEENWVRENGDNDYILMQYTGLKDANGVEIYEGDVLKYEPIPSFDPNPPDEIRFLVEWGAKGFMDNKARGHYYDYEKGVVIGNKYENPDLI